MISNSTNQPSYPVSIDSDTAYFAKPNKTKRNKLPFINPNMTNSISPSLDSHQTLFLKSPVFHPLSHQKCPKISFAACTTILILSDFVSISLAQFSTRAINARNLLLSMIKLSLSHSLCLPTFPDQSSSFLPVPLFFPQSPCCLCIMIFCSSL